MPNLTRIVGLVDHLYKRSRYHQKIRPGPVPKYTDLYILQMVVVQHLQGYTSESAYLRQLKQHQYKHFSKIPSQSQYNKRVKTLKSIVESLSQQALQTLKVDRTKIRIIDATAVPVTKLYRAGRTKAFKNKQHFGIGYCAAKKEWYYGLKLTIITNQQGIPITYHLMPANRHDIRALKGITRNLWNIWLIGDKGYVGKSIEEELTRSHRIRLITPYRKNQHKKRSRWERRKLKHRQIIERINLQLKDHLGLEKLRAKSDEGIETRIRNILFSYLMAVAYNKKYKQNLLSIKGILG